MPYLIPRPDQQAAFWRLHLEPGEHIESTWWFERRLPWMIGFLVAQGGLIGTLAFLPVRHRYFGVLTDRRLLLMGSSAWHNPVPGEFEAIDRKAVACTRFSSSLGQVAMDLQVAGEPGLRRFSVPSQQRRFAEACLNLIPTP